MKSQAQVIFIGVLCALGAGCTAISSQFDDVHLVYVSGQSASPSTPAGFVVSPEEMISLVPVTKWGFRLYADQQAYYLREEKDVVGVTSAAKTNSRFAKERGLRVEGRTRAEFEFLKRFQAEHPGASLEAQSNQLLLMYAGK